MSLRRRVRIVRVPLDGEHTVELDDADRIIAFDAKQVWVERVLARFDPEHPERVIYRDALPPKEEPP